jgi:hypothetical protein
VEFDHSRIYTGMFLGMAFLELAGTEFQWNSIQILFIYLYKQCLFGNQTQPLSSSNEDFTLPHIFQVDSARVQVIFQSPPGVLVDFYAFFLAGTTAKLVCIIHLDFTWTPRGVHLPESSVQEESQLLLLLLLLLL